MTWQVLRGDCVGVLAGLDDCSVDAVVTDPPYGLEFMGKDWDRFRTDDPGTMRNRGERAGEHGARQGGTYAGDGRPKAKVSYGGGKRSTTSRCTLCGKRDQWQNRHEPCGDGEWRQELIDPHAAPPTMLAFQQWTRLWALEAKRVLKPGGHLLAFGGTRTYHRLAAGVEDAGFEIRDTVCWMYGSGFPKSRDVSKDIDKMAGAERERVPGVGMPSGTNRYMGGVGHSPTAPNAGMWQVNEAATPEAERWQGWGTALKPSHEPVVVARKPLAGTVAGNVLTHGTGALNVDGCRIGSETSGGASGVAQLAPEDGRPGVGTSHPGPEPSGKEALAQEIREAGSRAEELEVIDRHRTGSTRGRNALGQMNDDGWQPSQEGQPIEMHPSGRWPANVVLSHTVDCVQVGVRKVKSPVKPYERSTAVPDAFVPGGEAAQIRGGPTGYASSDGTETVGDWSCSPGCPVRLLDEQTGELTSGSGMRRPHATPRPAGAYNCSEDGSLSGAHDYSRDGDTGGASRFFYVAKASRGERNAGLEGFEERDRQGTNGIDRPMRRCVECGRLKGGSDGNCQCGPTEITEERLAASRNHHPTVKPIELMRWLVRLVTPPNGTVLDCFAGSGTTGIAAVLEGFDFIGIEREPEYADIAEARIRWWEKHRGDGEAAAVLAAGNARDVLEQAGQLSLEGDAA